MDTESVDVTIHRVRRTDPKAFPRYPVILDIQERVSYAKCGSICLTPNQERHLGNLLEERDPSKWRGKKIRVNVNPSDPDWSLLVIAVLSPVVRRLF